MDLPLVLPASLRERLDEIISIHLLQEDVVALVATADQVLNGAGILDSHFAGHNHQGLDSPNPNAKPESKLYGSTPRTHPIPPGQIQR